MFKARKRPAESAEPEPRATAFQDTPPPAPAAQRTEPVDDAPAKSEAPETGTPKTDAPRTESPANEAPKSESSKSEPPKKEAPKTEAPKTEAPKTEAPKTEPPKSTPPAEKKPRRQRAEREDRQAGKKQAGKKIVAGANAVRSRIASLVWLVAVICALFLAIGALLVALNANRHNSVVSFILGGADKLDLGVFSRKDGIFTFHGKDAAIKDALVNWGIGAIVYLVVGKFVDRVIRP